MSLYQNAVSFTATFILLVIATLYLRHRRIVSATDAPMVSRLIVSFVLPALLFRQLAFFKPDLEVVRLSVYFVAVEGIVFVISYLIGRHLLVMPRRSLGVFSLCSTFGSTGILGTAFIAAVFNGDPNAVGKGLLISQLAVGIPANIVCPLVTLWTGDSDRQRHPPTRQLFSIAFAPSTIAIVLGISWSLLELPTTGTFISPLIKSMELVGESLFLLVALLNGLSLGPIPLREYISPVILCALFILAVEPSLLYFIDDVYGASLQERQISFMLAAMPASNSIIAFAVRNNADAKMASTLVISTAIISAISIPSLMPFFDIFR